MDLDLLLQIVQLFEGKKFQKIELMPPPDEEPRPLEHLDISTYGLVPPEDEILAEDFDNYSHPCWCVPELVFCDDVRGNEIWLHKRIQ